MNIYHKLPLYFQNFAVTIEGRRLKKQRYSGNFQKYLIELEKSQWFSTKKLEKIQLIKLKKILKHAYKNVPYYNKLFRKINFNPEIKEINDLKKIPTLKKQTLKKYKKEFIATNIPSKELVPYPTGGTTGTPLNLYTTKDAIRYNFAYAEARAKNWIGVKSGDRLATFLGKIIVLPERQKPPFWRNNKAYNQLLFSSFHLNKKNSTFYIKQFNDFEPTIVQGYPSIIHQFAKYILSQNKKIYQPKAILVSSETLFDQQKKDIEKAFDAPVYNSYSLAEFVVYVSQCEEGKLHISPEYGVVELIPIKENNKYEIVATTLFNYAMPLIRYETKDIVTASEKKICPCGRQLPIINSIEGRMDSMLRNEHGSYVSPASMSLVFQSLNNIKESQIIQNENDEIIVEIVKEINFKKKDTVNLIQQLKQRLGQNMKINIIFVNKIKRTTSGKFQFIISNISK